MEDVLVRSMALIAAVLPPLIIISYFLVSSRVSLNAELVWAGFVFGAVAAFPVIAIVTLYENVVGYGRAFYTVTTSNAFLGAAVPEEIAKLLALLTLCWRQLPELKSNHVFALAVVLSVGFACLENIFYVVDSDSWHTVAILRSISAVPGHAFVGAVMGWCIIRALRGSFSGLWWGAALFLPVLLHGIYDFSLMAVRNIEDRFLDAPDNLAAFFVSMFVLTVIFEGVVAHLCLRDILYSLKPNGTIVPNAQTTPIWGNRVQSAITHSLMWSALGVLCLLASAAYLLSDFLGLATGFLQPDALKRSMMQGFAVFAALHGAAFIGLAIIQRRRSREVVSLLSCR